jgi:phenylacetate-CoA ligase
LYTASQWQFIQETESEYILKINGKQNRDLDKIVELMRNLLGKDANITINYVDEIPVLASNKQRRTVCKIQKS